MLRRCLVRLPPKGKGGGGGGGGGAPPAKAEIRTEVGSNRYLEEPWFAKSNDMFAVPEFCNKPVRQNWRYFMKPGKAATGPPVGQDFSSMGLKAMDFAKAFNDKTKGHFKDDVDLVVRVQVYFDKTYSWRIEPPPISWYILKAMRKKRRETGPLRTKGRYVGYLSMEMCYEIAKCRGHWTPEGGISGSINYPPIEMNARSIAYQASRMGIAIIGVNSPDSPVKGMTQAQYEKQAADYRKQQWEQWEKFRQEELEKDAPLHQRLHRPSMERLPRGVLDNMLRRPNVLGDLWRATAPNSQSLVSAAEEKRLQQSMSSMNVIGKDLTGDEMKALLFNWRLPSIERMRQLKGVEEPYHTHWASTARDIKP